MAGRPTAPAARPVIAPEQPAGAAGAAPHAAMALPPPKTSTGQGIGSQVSQMAKTKTPGKAFGQQVAAMAQARHRGIEANTQRWDHPGNSADAEDHRVSEPHHRPRGAAAESKYVEPAG